MNKAIVLILAGILAVGCVPSWNPLYTEKDVIVDPQLVGMWKGEDGETWKFEKEDGKKYKLVYSDKEGKATFTAHLVKLRDKRFMNFFLHDDAEKDITLNGMSKMTLVPVHLFFRVDEIGASSVKMAAVNPDALDKLLKKNPKAVPHLKQDDRVMFTASTEELQAFVLENAKGEDLFGTAFTLARERKSD